MLTSYPKSNGTDRRSDAYEFLTDAINEYGVQRERYLNLQLL